MKVDESVVELLDWYTRELKADGVINDVTYDRLIRRLHVIRRKGLQMLDQDCHNCKHYSRNPGDEPCRDCESVTRYTKWESRL